MKLRERRELYGMSLKQAAKILGISNSLLSMIENGKRVATVKVAKRICKFYGMTLDELYEDVS